MALITEQYLDTILSAVAAEYNLSEWQYAKQTFESIGQNYFGIIIPVVLSGVTNGEKQKIPLVIKLAPTDERYRVSGAVTKFFAKEIFFYTKVLLKYQEIQHHLPMPQYIIPKCYFVCLEHCKEVIVMQDMCAYGYLPYTHARFLDLSHITVSLKALAEFHALSFIMRLKDQELYNKVMDECTPLTETTNKRFFDILLDRLLKAIKTFEDTKYVPLLESLKRDCAKLIEAKSGSVHELCISHGDIWKENILFKYKEKEPVSACLIDYQTVRKCSPAFDMLYLITTSTNASLRHKHFHQMVNTYYHMFAHTIKSAGLDVVYSKQALDDDLKVVAPSTFIVANTALWLSNGLQQEGHVRSKQVFSTEEEKARAVESYKEIISSVIDDYNTYGYFSL